MKCPLCPDTALVMAERQGVEIDYCPQCRGVWLDRGELDKIIERSLPAGSVSGMPAAAPPMGYAPRSEHHGHEGHQGYAQTPHRRKSWMSEIFD